MTAFSVDGIRGKAMLVAVASLGIVSWACANAPTTTLPAPTPMHLSEVQVESGDGGTVIRLVGPVDPVYTAFQQEDPPRVVVDLVGVSAREVPEATAVYDGTVEEVAVTPFSLGTGEDRTRVELSLVEPVAYDVVVLENQVEIRIAPEGTVLGETESFGSDSGTGEAAETPFQWTDEGVAETTETPLAEKPADSLLEVTAETPEAGARIHLLANGAILDADHFVLENPTRLVVDLPGMVSKTGGAVDVGADPVSRVRIGQHADKVRVVLDATEGFDFAQAALDTTFDGLLIRFDGGDGIASAQPWEAVEETAEAGTEEIAEQGAEGFEADAEIAAFEETAEIAETAEADAWAGIDEALEDESSFAADAADAAEVDEVDETVAEAGEEIASEIAETAEAGDAAWENEDWESQAWENEDWAAESESGAEAAPAEIAEAEATTTEVYGVQFDDTGEAERLVVLTDGVASYDVTEVAPDTLMVRIHGASIDPEAAVRIAPEPAGSVGLVTAFQQPEMDVPEVRVVVRRAAGVDPAVSQRGTMLFLDFPKTGEVASTVPMFDELEAAPEAPSTGAAKAVAQATAPAPAPPAAPAALEPLESVDILEEGGLIDGKVYTGRRISLDFKDVEIADVLRLIAEVSDLNIIAGDEVDGQVTIRLVDVPWDQALDVILLTRGLGFVRVGNVLRIAPADLLQAEEEARLQERRAKEKLEDLVVKLQPVNYASVDEVSKMITRLLTPRGTVDVDKRTNTLILKDIKSVIDEATALIKAIDTQTPQVLIEAKIVEANLDFSRELGSSFSFGTQPFEDGFDTSSNVRRDISLGRDLVFRGDNQVVTSNPITSIPTGLLDLGAFILDEKFNVDLQLEAAESNGEGKVISSPRVVTLDNRKASIEQGVSIPFQTFENGDARLEFIDAVLKLEVTPHITADRSIIMSIEVQRNAPDDSVQTPTGSPAIAKNQAETETLVKDGQTLVIGGIYVVNTSDRVSRVPYFHKIPILGMAFRNSEVRDIRKELLVFVTPRIVVNPEVAS